jgi:hypothetical protein
LASRCQRFEQALAGLLELLEPVDGKARHLIGHLREHGFERLADLVGAHVLEADLADFDLERVERGLNVETEHLGGLNNAVTKRAEDEADLALQFGVERACGRGIARLGAAADAEEAARLLHLLDDLIGRAADAVGDRVGKRRRVELQSLIVEALGRGRAEQAGMPLLVVPSLPVVSNAPPS